MSSSPPPPSRESEPKNPYFYSRKDKSLGLLCSNFLKLYNRDGVDTIGLDDAANRLGVERRRIYDIVNILESIGVLTKKGKNQYSWKGFGGIPQALDKLKEEAARENLSMDGSCSNSENVSSENHCAGSSDSKTDRRDKTSVPSKVDNRKEKSLGLLTQNFVKLFLSAKVNLISLDNAATALLGDVHDPTAMKNNSAAKVRRLYDIANVFSSMNLLEKTHHPESRKPAFRWLGFKGSLMNATASGFSLNESKKRAFGTEITNILPKKHKSDSSLDCDSNKGDMQMHTAHDLKSEHSGSLELQGKHGSKSFVFGPFAPASLSKVGDSENKDGRQLKDLEDLASTYRPQYSNQALNDLFDHYASAWTSWFVEVAGKKEIREVS